MLRKIIFIAPMLCCFFSLNLLASKQYMDLSIKEIAMGWGGEGVYIYVNEQIEIADSCTQPIFQMSANAPLFKENYSMLLSAYHSDKKVGLYVDGCLGAHMQLKALRMRK